MIGNSRKIANILSNNQQQNQEQNQGPTSLAV